MLKALSYSNWLTKSMPDSEEEIWVKSLGSTSLVVVFLPESQAKRKRREPIISNLMFVGLEIIANTRCKMVN